MLCLTVSIVNSNFLNLTVRFKILHVTFSCGHPVFRDIHTKWNRKTAEIHRVGLHVNACTKRTLQLSADTVVRFAIPVSICVYIYIYIYTVHGYYQS
jgi:hypothetical protein